MIMEKPRYRLTFFLANYIDQYLLTAVERYVPGMCVWATKLE